MKPTLFLAFLAAPALALAVPVEAQEAPTANEQTDEQTPLEFRAEQIVAVINSEIDPKEVFSAEFLKAVPLAQLAAVSAQFTSQFGPAIAVESIDPADGTRGILALRMERAIARGPIAIDPSDENRVSELLFQSFEAIDDSPAKIEADLANLPGEVSWWFGPIDGSSGPLIADRASEQMPLGSTFKLYVLAALARDIAAGKRAWGDVVNLGDTRSFPSGMMQDWPTGASVTLETLASLMISISDNTATDALIDVLGRDAVLQAVIDSGHSSPELNDPFLKTRDMFLLKAGPEGRLHTYSEADADVRSQILEGIDEPVLPMSTVQAAFSGGPIALDVEWFASARDLAGLMRFMRRTADPRAFEIMAISPNMPENARSNWTYAGYKGGSEPGVLNLTWLLTDQQGRDHALILSWRNDDANVDQNALELIAQRMLALPR
ncbi:serine hydrolase [Erythrobacter aurantius]|uniref:serine hydrolase n=1 Tax=Erythrobacter aurantius TaxID=2909249 RepID=UPI00207AB8D7|nr:serine hydrolase [Erythrobacter aurantius]